MIKYVKGNILNSPEHFIILQQVNCQSVMGKGLAYAIYHKYPFVRDQYFLYCQGILHNLQRLPRTPDTLLGTYFIAQHANYERKVVCMFSQLNYRPYYVEENTLFTNYEAFETILADLAREAYAIHTLENPVHFAVPYNIGCGLGGGKWEIIEPLIIKYLNCFDTKIYYLRD